jgi:hypothetical protein
MLQHPNAAVNGEKDKYYDANKHIVACHPAERRIGEHR